MSLTDEIERLQSLKSQGHLSDEEFAAAKAKLLGSQTPPPPSPASTAAAPKPTSSSKLLDPKENARGLVRILVLLGVLGGGGYLALRYTMGGAMADRAVAVVARSPIVLHDAVENVSASSWQGVPLSLPYDGTLNIEVKVNRGNGQTIVLLKADQITDYKAKRSFRSFPDFDAKKATTYKRSGRLAAGSYYLVLRDDTLGLLSSSSSDVKVTARLDP